MAHQDHGYYSDSSEEDPIGFVPTTVISHSHEYYEELVWGYGSLVNSHKHPCFNIIIVPGNPGHPSFYQNYVQCLVPKLPPNIHWRISVVGLKGHVSNQCRQKANWFEYIKGSSIHYNLNQQIEHISSYIEMNANRYNTDSNHSKNDLFSQNEKTIIIGHSIGSYIGLEAIRKHPNSVHAFLGIMPFLERNLESKEYLSLRFLLKYFWPLIFVAAFLAEIASYLPSTVQHSLLKSKMQQMDVKIRDFTVSSMLAFGVICNYLYLGKTEFIMLDQPFDFKSKVYALPSNTPSSSSTSSIISIKNKIEFLYTDNDFWAPLQMEKKISKFGIKTSILKNVPHAFGVSTCSSEIIAEWTAKYLSKIIKK